MIMRKFFMILALGILIAVITACGSSNTEEENNTSENNASENTSEKSSDNEADKTITVEHELGQTEIQKNPEKVVVFDFGILDTFDRLGLDVAGVAKSSTLPTYLEKYSDEQYENVGSLKEPDFETLANIDPDLIIISGRQAPVYDQLMEIAPTIYLGVDTTRYMDSFKENMGIIGEIFNKQGEVKEELEKIDDAIATLQGKANENGENALIILANDDKISAYGPNSRFGMIHDVFGIPAVDENIEASTHGMNVTFEYVLEQDPEMLYVIDRGAVVNGESSAKQIVENELVEGTKAFQNDNIFYLNPEFWYLSGGGLVSVSEMVNEISSSLE